MRNAKKQQKELMFHDYKTQNIFFSFGKIMFYFFFVSL